MIQSIQSNETDPQIKLSATSQQSESSVANGQLNINRQNKGQDSSKGYGSSGQWSAASRGLAIQVSQRINQREEILNSLLKMNSPVAGNLADRRNPAHPNSLGKNTFVSRLGDKNFQDAAAFNINQSEQQRPIKPLMISQLSDERNCNLTDESLMIEPASLPFNRSVQTPGNATRKSSINQTPKSRVIEPGKIFSSRQMTPSANTGMHRRMLNQKLTTGDQNNKLLVGSITASNRHSSNGLIMQQQPTSGKQGFR